MGKMQLNIISLLFSAMWHCKVVNVLSICRGMTHLNLSVVVPCPASRYPVLSPFRLRALPCAPASASAQPRTRRQSYVIARHGPCGQRALNLAANLRGVLCRRAGGLALSGFIGEAAGDCSGPPRIRRLRPAWPFWLLMWDGLCGTGLANQCVPAIYGNLLGSDLGLESIGLNGVSRQRFAFKLTTALLGP